MPGLLAVFPGLGSQYAGMGRSLHDAYPIFRDSLAEAGDILGMDMAGLCVDKTRGTDLASLRNAQLAMVAASVATCRVMRSELGLLPHAALGHSLGEYAALCCAGAISFRAALEIVSRREALIAEQSATLDGTMMWVVKPASADVEAICSAVSTPESRVFVSAYDHATQNSISGHRAAVTVAAGKLEAAGATLFPLRGSGPWHCPLMAGVARRLRVILDDYEFAPARFPVISNVTARPYPSAPAEMRDLLARQIEMPLLLAESLRWLEGEGIRAAVSPGPKDVMKFLVEKNSRRIRAHSLERADQVAALRDSLVLAPEDLGRAAANCIRAVNTTPNYNDDPAAYRDQVVAPYRRLEDMVRRRTASGTSPDLDSVREMVDAAEAILRAKHLSAEAVFDGLDRIWCDKFPAADLAAEAAHV